MNTFRIVVFAILAGAIASAAVAQTPTLVKRTITKTDRFDFGVGGTVVITGAPTGSIRVVGTVKNEVEITAEIELQAPTETDLERLAAVTTFITEEGVGRTGIITTGTHNRLGGKALWKKFPKNLIGLPFRVDYVISIPRFTDLEIDGGTGDLSVTAIEGALRLNFIESTARLEVVGGSMTATFQKGTVDVSIGVRGWRGRFASVQVGTGTLNVRLPSTMSAELDAVILRTGAIENNLPDLKPRDRKVPFTDKAIVAKAGVGGVSLKFTVGDGTLRLERLTLPL